MHINPVDRSKDRIFVASFSVVSIIDPKTFQLVGQRMNFKSIIIQMVASSSLNRVFLLHKEMRVSRIEEEDQNEFDAISKAIDSKSVINEGATFVCFASPDTLILGTTHGLLQIDFPNTSPQLILSELVVKSIAKLNPSQAAICVLHNNMTDILLFDMLTK